MMETTICPWCHTEIVWDEELGPEEYCPHCSNELGGYRTVSISPEDLDDEPEEQDDEDDIQDDKLWDDEDREGVIPVVNVLDRYRDTHDMHRYAQNAAAALDEQIEAPECPVCHEYMLLAGTQTVPPESYVPHVTEVLGAPVLAAPFAVQLHVCPSCFHVQHSLAEEGRQRLLAGLTSKRSR